MIVIDDIHDIEAVDIATIVPIDIYPLGWDSWEGLSAIELKKNKRF